MSDGICDCDNCKHALQVAKASPERAAMALRGLAQMAMILGNWRCAFQRLRWAEQEDQRARR